MRLLRVIFKNTGPHRDEQRKNEHNLVKALKENTEATERNKEAINNLVELLSEGVLQELHKK